MFYIKKLLLSLLLLNAGCLEAIETTLLIKISSWSKQTKLFKVLDSYYSNLSKKIPYAFIITCQEDDMIMNNKIVKKKLKKYPNLIFDFINSRSQVQSYNHDINNHKFSMLLVASDDIVPVVKNFDLIIYDAMKQEFPNFDGVLNLNSGSRSSASNALPLLGENYYKCFGYVYNPLYEKEYHDVELTNVSRLLKKEKVLNKQLFANINTTNKSHTNKQETNIPPMGNDFSIFCDRRNRFFDLPLHTIESFYPKTWSILICTMEERKKSFEALYLKLQKQICELNLENDIEVLFFQDKRGENTIGYKRNALLAQSKGKYTCFIDDDDEIHDKYIELIYRKLVNNPDCVSLTGIITFDGKKAKKFVHSIQYQKYFESNNEYFRPPNHLNPIRRAIAIQFAYPEKNHGEDTDWAMQVANSGLLKTEEIIDEPYYFYLFATRKNYNSNPQKSA